MSAINPTGQNTRQIGRTIFSQATAALMKNKVVLVVPVTVMLINVVLLTSVVFGSVAFFVASGIDSSNKQLSYVIAAVVYISMTIVQVFANAVLMVAANDVYEGKPVNLSRALQVALSKFGKLLSFALLEATLGLVMRVIAERFGSIGGGLLKIFSGLAWAIASYFSIPAILFNNAGPVESLKQSGSLIKTKWGNVWRANVVASAVIVAAMFVGFGFIAFSTVLFISAIDSTNSAALFTGAGLTAALGIGLMLVAGLIQSAVIAFVKVALYRHVNGFSTGDIDPQLLESGFKFRK